MVRKTTFIMLAVVAMLLLPFADCMSAIAQDYQTMQCCGSMPCDSSNQSHDCCKGMVPSQSPTALPAAQLTLHPPVMVVTDALLLAPAEDLFELSSTSFGVSQHSPPELYTLHSSLLI